MSDSDTDTITPLKSTNASADVVSWEDLADGEKWACVVQAKMRDIEKDLSVAHKQIRSLEKGQRTRKDDMKERAIGIGGGSGVAGGIILVLEWLRSAG